MNPTLVVAAVAMLGMALTYLASGAKYVKTEADERSQRIRLTLQEFCNELPNADTETVIRKAWRVYREYDSHVMYRKHNANVFLGLLLLVPVLLLAGFEDDLPVRLQGLGFVLALAGGVVVSVWLIPGLFGIYRILRGRTN